MKIELTTKEIEMVELLEPFAISLDEPYEQRERKLKVSAELMHSLLDRQVIPKVRLKYFTQAEYNLPSARKSRQQVFEHNGRSGSRIFEDPAFLKYLKYFIWGAELPSRLKVELSAAKLNSSCENEFVEQAISLVKRHRAPVAADDQMLAEEVFKYALDIGVELLTSHQIWDIVLQQCSSEGEIP